MTVLGIIRDNSDFLKISAIEDAIGLPKTTLVRALARNEMPEKYREEFEMWWMGFAKNLATSMTDTSQIEAFAKKIAALESENHRLHEEMQKILQHKKVSLSEFLKASEQEGYEKDHRSPYQRDLARRKGEGSKKDGGATPTLPKAD